MKLEDKAIVGVLGLGALYFLTRNSTNERGAPTTSPLQTAAVAAGNTIGTAIPQVVWGAAEGAAKGFTTSSYNSGTATGAAINQMLTPTSAKNYTGVNLPASVYALPPDIQEPIWDAAYAQKTDIFTQLAAATPWSVNAQMLKGASETWNKLLTGW